MSAKRIKQWTLQLIINAHRVTSKLLGIESPPKTTITSKDRATNKGVDQKSLV